jgi:enoyl-CoA hydratase/carnithine racemase
MASGHLAGLEVVMDVPATETLTLEVRDHVLEVGPSRPDKLNAFNLAMLRELSEAFTFYEEQASLRCLLLFAHGERAFTAGLELDEVGPAVMSGANLFPEDGVNPLGLHGRRCSKPVVMAVHGWCLTIGIELMLAADVRVCGTDTRFGQIEVARGIMPYGGATLRFAQVAGWGDAMRYLLTGDKFGADEALRMGLVCEVCDEPVALGRRIAETIAAQAPLAVQATLANARIAVEQGHEAGLAALMAPARALMHTEDAAEGVRSFLERRQARFTGT